MAPTATYPGVYVYEAPPSGARPIVGVSTSICAMVLDLPRGPVNYPIRVFDAAGVNRNFGSANVGYRDFYLLDQFFVNGGATLYVIRGKRDGARAAKWATEWPPLTDIDGIGNSIEAALIAVGITDVASLASSSEQQVAEADGVNESMANDFIAEACELIQETSLLLGWSATAGRHVVGRDDPVEDVGEWGNGLRLQIIPNDTARFTLEVTWVNPDNPTAPSDIAETHSALTVESASRAIAANSDVISLTTDDTDPPFTGTWAATQVPPFDSDTTIDDLTVTVTDSAGATTVNVGDIEIPEDTVASRVAALVERAIRAEAAEVLADDTTSDEDAQRARHLRQVSVRVIDGRLYLQAGLFPGYDDGVELTLSAVTELGLAGDDDDLVGPVRHIFVCGADGDPLTATEIIGDRLERSGIYAMEDVDFFNILCLPGLSTQEAATASTAYEEAATYCEERRAFLIMDMPGTDAEGSDSAAVNEPAEAEDWISSAPKRDNAAVYFPRLVYRTRDEDMNVRELKLPNSPAIAGIYARTDSDRNVWKAPAGLETDIRFVNRLDYVMNDSENGFLNPLGCNALRTFPVNGTVVWGARTLRGADSLADQYKYVPVRRMAYFIEESLYRGTQWAVFEPNDEPLWSQLRLSVGAFMHQQFRKGAFQGATPREAYLVKCDSETTTQADIDRGIVNIIVGFAPLKPAEFVFIEIQQLARAEE